MCQPHSQIDAIADLAAVLRQVAHASRHRRALLLSGSQEWCFAAAEAVSRGVNRDECLWISRQAPTGVNALEHTAVLKRLGAETDLVVYDAHCGFDADAFGAVCGLIRAGGLLLLLAPPLAQWPRRKDPEAQRFFKSDGKPSRFLTRFIGVALQADGLVHVSEKGEIPRVPKPVCDEPKTLAPKGVCRSEDQARAVETIVSATLDRFANPVVLISDRGRGKSAALGIAAAQLMQQGLQRILVAGPRLNSAAAVFEHAHRLLSGATQKRGLITLGDARLEYVAPDELIASRPEAELLLVDEAAAIPTPMLARLLEHYPQIVFATTLHGYEGTGRGFALRFNKVLDRQRPGWRQLRLQQPIRWRENDPLEQFVFHALLLNASIAAESALDGLDQFACRIEMVTRDRLVQDESLLSQVFGLLVLAHYRTRPNDLRQLLDSAGLLLYVVRHRQHVVGVALLLEEGGIDNELGRQVYLGRRRLQGHLLPQSLAVHAGLPVAPQLRYLRIMRIAVHPAIQGQGLGSALVRHISQQADPSRYDCIGSSFGVTAELLRFWRALDFVPARLGVTREHSSGTYSLIMLYPLSNRGRQLTASAYARLQTQLPYLLPDSLPDLDQEIVRSLIDKGYTAAAALNEADWQDILSFAYGARGYEFCIASITRLAEIVMRDSPVQQNLDAQQLRLLKVRVLEKGSWADAVAETGLSGRAAAIALLRNTIRELAEHLCPEELNPEIS